MTKEQEVLLELVRIEATEECTFTDTLLSVDWNESPKLAAKQGVPCLCMNALEVMLKYAVDICPTEAKL